MNTKSRVTLDNSGLRLRPRSYADTYVPKRVAPRLVNDISAYAGGSITPHQTTLQPKPYLEFSTADAAGTARLLLQSKPIEYPVEPQTHTPIVACPEQPIAELISQIQHTGFVEPVGRRQKGSGGWSILTSLRTLHISWASRSVLASAMAVLLITGGLIALFSSIHSNKLVTMQVQALSDKSEQESDESEGQTSSAQPPSEDKVPDAVISNYSVASDLPKYISIPKIKISKTRVLRLGLDKDGAPKTPRNVWDTGWYEGSSKPSDATGAALIMGHVSGPTNGGIFYNLYRLSNGDEIQVTEGDGTIHTYKVVAKEEVPVSDINMNNYLVSKNVDKPGLTLMTCAGEFNPKTQTYDKRLAVFAIRSN